MKRATLTLNKTALVTKLQKNSLITLCALMVICGIALDATTRFTQDDSDTNQGSALGIQSAYILSKLSDEQAQAVAQLLIARSGEVEKPNQENMDGLSEQDKKMQDPEQQKAQQGELSELYIGNNRYELVGIFRHAQPFAVFRQSTINAKATAITEQNTSYKWTKSQAIEQFMLSEIHQNSITIQNGEHTITMRIFSPL
ncbi:hypothetical protein [Vibrio rotiferianus]|uniref:hypothetical protein n=1 Tax=Vibrio rotiferianus TaxID=190895 RepID=UPI000B59EC24|nr:hypothetical protein [Vibrio rotiferianus]ASI97587.1 hypothetical protein BSZ04_22185 [Vibrio rotiferianus]